MLNIISHCNVVVIFKTESNEPFKYIPQLNLFNGYVMSKEGAGVGAFCLQCSLLDGISLTEGAWVTRAVGRGLKKSRGGSKSSCGGQIQNNAVHHVSQNRLFGTKLTTRL